MQSSNLCVRIWVSGLLMAGAFGCAASDGAGEQIVTGSVSRVEVERVPAGADLASQVGAYLGRYQEELELSPADRFVAGNLPPGFEGVRRAVAKQTYLGLPVIGSTIDVRADSDSFVGFSGTVTRNLDGFDVRPGLGAERAAEIARRGLLRFTPTTATGIESGAVELVIAPRAGQGADLAWQVELSIQQPGETEPWVALVSASSGEVLAALPASGGCSFWDKLECELLPNPARALCLSLVCGSGEQAVCGDHMCTGDETDASCRQDCGCSATSGCETVAPYGCWCDADCDASGDCCSDASTCYLPPEASSDDGTCGWGEKSAGYLDRAKLTFYRAKYFAIAEAGGFLKDAPEARDLLLHYLGNSGTDVEIDVDKMLAEIPSFTEKVKQDRKRSGEMAVADAEAAGATSRTTAIPDETLSHSVEQAESYNWWAAIHRFEYKHVGEVTVTKSGETWSYTVTSKVVLRDHYDWDRDAPNAGPGGAFNQRELDDLNCFGWAKEFWCTGMSAKGELMGVAP